MIPSIANLEGYTRSMSKSLEEKLFWAPWLLSPQAPSATSSSLFSPLPPPTSITDYGCADGTLLKALRVSYSLPDDLPLLGIDSNPKMLSMARIQCPTACYAKSLDAVALHTTTDEYPLINLSSVIHEVYSFADAHSFVSTQESSIISASLSSFWRRLSSYTYICIRDMCISSSVASQEAHLGTFLSPLEKLSRESFEALYGTINNVQNYIHYLLKYRYTDNWARELQENYLPLYLEDYITILKDTHDVIYLNHYLPTYIHDQIYKDWGIDLTYKTHIQIILRRKDAMKGVLYATN